MHIVTVPTRAVAALAAVLVTGGGAVVSGAAVPAYAAADGPGGLVMPAVAVVPQPTAAASTSLTKAQRKAVRKAQRDAERAKRKASRSASRSASRAARRSTAATPTATSSTATSPSGPAPTATTPATTNPGTTVPTVTGLTCPTPTTTVTDAAELDHALTAARPGSVIRLADGVYPGRFRATTPGTPGAPVWLCGGRGAILDAGSVSSGYALHLDGASNWRVLGFTVRNAQKGIVLDGVSSSVVAGLAVTRIGDEGIHLRRHSSGNLVRGNVVSVTGLKNPAYGEGVYVGSAKSNWCTYTACAPDRSDRNVVEANTITATTSEAIDVKEGTTGGVLRGNVVDSARTTAADSAVDVKGNSWRVERNSVTAAPYDGFQTHRILAGWGDRNVFDANVVRSAQARGGFVVALTPALSNVARCTNRGPAGTGVSKTGCAS